MKNVFKVDKCGEFHAGAMGGQTCLVNDREIHHTTDHGHSGPPPEWCPLLAHNITVKL